MADSSEWCKRCKGADDGKGCLAPESDGKPRWIEKGNKRGVCGPCHHKLLTSDTLEALAQHSPARVFVVATRPTKLRNIRKGTTVLSSYDTRQLPPGVILVGTDPHRHRARGKSPAVRERVRFYCVDAGGTRMVDEDGWAGICFMSAPARVCHQTEAGANPYPAGPGSVEANEGKATRHGFAKAKTGPHFFA
eukprot:g792.t1